VNGSPSGAFGRWQAPGSGMERTLDEMEGFCQAEYE